MEPMNISEMVILFLSTPSARRATLAKLQKLDLSDISIHALREEGDFFASVNLQVQIISIHALREEGDVITHRAKGCI